MNSPHPPTDGSSSRRRESSIMDEEYARETNLAHLVARVGTASTRSYEHRRKLVKKKVGKLTKPIEASINIDNDEDLGPHKLYVCLYICVSLSHTLNSLSALGDDLRSAYRQENAVNINRKAKEELLAKVKFATDDYQSIFKDNTTSVRPLIQFFKYLIPKPSGFTDQSNYITRSKLHLAIPYTVVYGVEENPILYYTSKEGYVVRVDNPSSSIIKKKLTYNTRSEGDLAVVLKRPLVGETVTNHSSLLNTKQVTELLENPSQGTCVFQRYVKCKGSKACIARIIWSNTLPCTGYMISNKKNMFDMSEKEPAKRLLINTDIINSLHIYKMNGSAVAELERTTGMIAKYVQNCTRPKITISEMACDFIRDEDGQYWFLQVKALKRELPSSNNRKQKSNNDEDDDEDMGGEGSSGVGSGSGNSLSSTASSKRRKDYIRLKECRMCLNQYPPNELTYAMSLKMIYATEKHLKRRSVRLAWFDRPEFNNIKDTSVWYQAHKVCKNWYEYK
jgi:hypothetical protein